MLERFPENLRILRERSNLSQTQLARHLGLTSPYISYLEGGKRTPHPEQLFKIADFFGVTVDALVRGTFDAEER
jgi:transcriptional regulator with XRE-family HTH domain